ncbi:MAG: cell division/cell wall cluster transcriptional repressor MraZ [Clostridia bacterium]|nr:cell division/cell wall cluster transcriptional repressor MraZ [Clostridia bacterium]
MFYLTGEYAHQMDTKNRIRIPNKLKGDEKGLYFSKGTNNCLFVYYEAGFKELVQKLEESVKISDTNKQKSLRVFAKSFTYVEGDSQGRMILPQKLKEYAKIDKDLVICGAGARIEIWAKEVYDKYFEQEDEDFDELFGLLDI